MSGPIRPPLRVRDSDSSPNVIPVNTIVVSDGDLVDDGGAIVTIDTSGSGTTPGGSDTEVQFNDGGAFGGSADFTFTDEGAAIPKFNILSSTTANKGILAPNKLTLDAGDNLAWISSTDGDDGIWITTGTDVGDGASLVLSSTDASNHISLRNAAEDGTITIDTTLGTGDITVNANGDLNLWGDDTVKIRHQSGGAVNVQSAVDTPAVLQVKTDGAGTPQLNLLDDSKSITLQCDTNQKLKVDGGSYNFIFDASGAATGITWPDGTTQTTAASGGGMAPFVATAMATTHDTFFATAAAPYPNNILASDNQTVNFETPLYQPFVCPADLDIVNIQISVVTAVAATNCEVGIYSASSSTGSPSTLLTSATFDVSTTGYKTTTLGATQALTAGTLYYLCYVRDAANNFVLRSHPGEAIASGFIEGIGSFNEPLIYETGTDNTLPTTTTTANLEVKYGYNVMIALGV